LHAEIEAEFYQSLGIEISPETLSRRFAGVADIEVYRTLERETGRAIPPGVAAQIDRRKAEVFEQRLEPMPGILDALKAVQDIPRCIASGTKVQGLKHMLGIVNLYGLFAPHIYSAEMVERGKPFPDLFLHAAAQMGHNPHNCWVIEDAVSGVRGGKAAGMRVLGFVGGSHCGPEDAERLKAAGAELVFSDMRELPSLMERHRKPGASR
jgi:HAD superfamily hydrolase (TIGR01509 family)